MKCINPKCASTAAFIASDHGEVSMPPFYVRCPQCGAQGPKVDTPHRDEERLDACAAEALTAWNDIAAAVQAGVKALEVLRG